MYLIEYKAKRVDNGQWVHGHYFKTPLTDEATGSKPEEGWHFLTGRGRYCIATENGCVYEVNPETVGQYIGQRDFFDRRIYEYDIVQVTIKHKNSDGTYTEYLDTYVVRYNTSESAFMLYQEGVVPIAITSRTILKRKIIVVSNDHDGEEK